MQNSKTESKKLNDRYLSTCIEFPNHDDLALLWKDITTEKVVCVDVEKYVYYKFNKESLIYDCIGLNEFTELVKNELKSYLKDMTIVNTDKRLKELIQKICSKNYSSDIAQVASNKIRQKDFFALMDTNTSVVNFKNGYVSLKTGKFSVRTKDDKYYYSKCLDYDYNDKMTDVELKKESVIMTEIEMLFLRICNDCDQLLDFMLSWLGYNLTGETKEQKCLFVLGHLAENGKSTMYKIFEKCFPCYTHKLEKETFEAGYTKVHKQIQPCKGIRMVYIEEFSKKKMDTSLFKDLVDGNSKSNEVLFAYMEIIKILFKLNFLTNHIPNFGTDAGVKRRGYLANMQNRFLEPEDFKGEKNTYPKILGLESKFDKNEYKHAFFKLLLKYSIQYYKKGLTVYKPAKDAFKDICAENDNMQSFIDKYYIKTDDENDKIYKDEFMNLYNMHYKVKIPWTSLLSDAKRCGIEYDKDKRTVYLGLSQRGVITKLKLRVEESDDDNNFDEDYDYGIDKKDQSVNILEAQKKQYEELEEKYKALLASINPPDIEAKLIKKSKSNKSNNVEAKCKQLKSAGDNIEQAFGKYL